ncbi:hypothetical protein LTR15_002466 [Elasticomyces elasticus]|nr:hypothetical protein LTR15_002466 [Elasticomyces elasticus]
MPASTPSVNDLKAAFEARSKPTTLTLVNPPEIANKMFSKFSPVKNSIDSVLGTAKSSLTLPAKAPSTSTTPASSPPTTPPPASPVASTPPSPVLVPTSSAVPLPPRASSPPPAAQPGRALARPAVTQKPSWIGPPRAMYPAATMKSPATVEYTSKGLQPPVYVFTSLSDPQWEPLELDHEKQADGENRFYKTFVAEEGEYQYKFRLGPGDWWALDESKPTVDDGAGNKNNLMIVKPVAAVPQPPKEEPKVKETAKSEETAPSQPTRAASQQAPASPLGRFASTVSDQLSSAASAVSSTVAPLIPREQSPPVDKPAPTISNPLPAVEAAVSQAVAPLVPHEQSAASEKPATATFNPLPAIQTELSHTLAPLMKHESFFPEGQADVQRNALDDDEDETGLVEEDNDLYEHQQSPLLRHETLGPDSDEHMHSPLMRHESMGLRDMELDHTYSQLSTTSSGTSAEDAISPEADPNDPSLEKFPTHSAGIFEHIHSASTRLPADEIEHAAANMLSRERSKSPSMPSVQEEEEEEDEVIDMIRGQERAQADKEEKEHEVDPLADRVPKLLITEPKESKLITLITPPMTPEETEHVLEHLSAKEVEQLRNSIAEAKLAGEVVVELVQERSMFGVMVDVLMHPMTLFAYAGIALAVAVGIWKLRYA